MTSKGKAGISGQALRDLAHFSSCDDLATHLKDKALAAVTAYGLHDMEGLHVKPAFAGPEALARPELAQAKGPRDIAVDSVAASAEMAAGGADYSPVNTQEDGVGEFAKAATNGKVIAIATPANQGLTGSTAARIRLVDPKDLKDLATLHLGVQQGKESAELAFVDEHTLAVLSLDYKANRTLVSRIDISDPTKPAVTSTARLSQISSGARLIGDNLIVSLSEAMPSITFEIPKDASLQAERDALEANKRIIERVSVDQWFPQGEVLDGDTNPVGKPQALTACDQVYLKDGSSPFLMTAVHAINLGEKEIKIHPGAAINQAGHAVYASTDRFIGWSEDYNHLNGEVTTNLAAFDVTKPDAISLTALGQVPGVIPNSWAVDESKGTIRIASTVFAHNQMSSQAHVLKESDGHLERQGVVKDLGKGEEIKGVRWLTDRLGVVVTFREMDPVYTLDTSDPTAPKMVGELKIPGYSTYLHPVSETRLLALGQQADIQTGQPQGFKYSLFDIADLANPKEIDTLEFAGAESGAELDHHLFTWFKDRGYSVFSRYGHVKDVMDDRAGTVTTINGVRIDGDKLIKMGTSDLSVTLPDNQVQPIVIEDALFAVHPGAIERFDAESIKSQAGRTFD